MYRGTTPTLYLELDTDLSLANLTELWVTFKTTTAEVTKTLEDVTVDDTTKKIIVRLSQEETLKVHTGNCDVQVRFRTANNLAYASTIASISIERILKEGVI